MASVVALVVVDEVKAGEIVNIVVDEGGPCTHRSWQTIGLSARSLKLVHSFDLYERQELLRVFVSFSS